MILDTIKQYQTQHGYTPNIQVLAELLNKHPNTIRYHIDRLIAGGQLKRVKRENEGHYDICG